jgi:hypothetical protein
MRHLIVMSVAAAGVSVGLTAATAADISPAPAYAKAPVVAAPVPFSWSGFYLGAQGGAGWGTTTDDVQSATQCFPDFCFTSLATLVTPQHLCELGNICIRYRPQLLPLQQTREFRDH